MDECIQMMGTCVSAGELANESTMCVRTCANGRTEVCEEAVHNLCTLRTAREHMREHPSTTLLWLDLREL